MIPKVSLVVPIYKVEQYLAQCVESILRQTYPNLEIILVNDGSPDNCGHIADRYAALDPRVYVIHKENGGLSDARNVGMQRVTGDYVLFVDSDDWLDEKMVEEMVNKSLSYEADVVQSAFYYAYDDHLLYDNRYFSREDEPLVLDRQRLMKELVINEKVKNFAWGKLFKTNLARDIPFKKGVLFEDVFWAHQVMHRAQTYVILHQPMFYYRQRKDSIVATYTPRNLDYLRGLKERHSFIASHYQELSAQSYKNILNASLIHYNLLFLNKEQDKGGALRREIQNYVKNHHQQLKKAAKNDNGLSRQLTWFVIHPNLYLVYNVVIKGLKKLKVISQPSGLERINL
ncbi:beta-1,4-galactosyltransferase [Ammoniphilus oxalaticus]|uniref:Beta-1,4-galactosyltransferase n=1 Tax=Ammoniphilus oxalaticus TaxID=66863 RepID=A0A419SHA2_9BACL|nr:glycosyltransferase family 2 protein [Ammoniphilus oxalaticus]RKD23170.1 beta-1,4-galactosyltransferase [Ammoniphilus oxalaticus]